jgi:HlyD family secretion protein
VDILRTDVDQRRRRRWLLMGAGAALATAAGLALAMLDPMAPEVDARTLYVDTVTRGDLERRVRGAGVFVPRDQRWIAADVEGRVERVLVRPGTEVAADTILVELSNPQVQQQADEARWALDAGRAEQASLRVRLESDVLDQRARIAEARAESEAARLQAEAEGRLAGQKIISDLQLARSRLTAEQLAVRLQIEEERLEKLQASIEAQLRAGLARVEQLRRAWEHRNGQVEALRVRAGLDGVLQALAVESGQQLALGASIARVARPGSLLAELRIAEIEAKDLEVGLNATIDTRNGVVAGRVERVEPAVRNGTVKVDVTLTGALPVGARADLSVEGVIEIEHLENVLHVARPVNVQPESPATLFRVSGSSDALRVPVKFGKASVDRIVIADGLDEGDRVIVSDVGRFERHDRLTLD